MLIREKKLEYVLCGAQNLPWVRLERESSQVDAQL